MSVSSLFSTYNHLSQKIAGRRAVASSRTRIVLVSLIFPETLLKTSRPLTAIILVTASRQGCCYLRLIAYCPGEGRTGRTSSGPTSVVFNLFSGRLYPAHRLQAPLPPLQLSVCFSCGELGVGEKPTRGELVRSRHRVPSSFISSQRFSFETLRVSQHSMGLAAAYGPFFDFCLST